jgi:hypothetical protein
MPNVEVSNWAAAQFAAPMWFGFRHLCKEIGNSSKVACAFALWLCPL